jgi:predicted GIY-YIG superfamily endonuclease
MPNVKSIISSHNKKVLSATKPTEQEQTDKKCNCRKKRECPLEGKCLQKNVVYQATVTTETTKETYVGLATDFKERYRNHKCSLNLEKRKNETELSKYVWKLKEEKKNYSIKWKILKQCQPYSNTTKKCNLCLSEKFIIICKKHLCSLNKRNELASQCKHRNRFTLRNYVN